EDGTPYFPPVTQSVVNDSIAAVRDDQMTSTPHTVSYSPSNSEGRLSIGTDDANVPHSVQFSPTAVRHSLRNREVRGSIPDRVKPRSLKLALAADPPSVWPYEFSVKSGRPGVRIM
ncbi:hypothetical protein ElyMa_000355700, partial [Elysia marginata]